jgi:hypothetical protein
MALEFTPVTIPLLLSGIVAVGLFGLAVVNRDAKGAYPLAALFVGIAVWSLAYAVYLASDPGTLKDYLDAIRFFGISTTPVTVFVFALEYAGVRHLVTKRNVALLSIVPAITNVLVWTNPAHQLFWATRTVQEGQLVTTWGPWFGVHALYSFALGFGAIGLFAYKYVVERSEEGSVGQTRAFLVATLFPLVGSLVTNIGGLQIDLAPFGFMITAVMLTAAIFYY